jgi:hypothetical protein
LSYTSAFPSLGKYLFIKNLEYWDGFVTNQDVKYANLKITGAPSATGHVTKEPKNTVFLA